MEDCQVDCEGDCVKEKRSFSQKRFLKKLGLALSCGTAIILVVRAYDRLAEKPTETAVTVIENVASYHKFIPTKRKIIGAGIILIAGAGLVYFSPPIAVIKCTSWRLFYRIAYRTIWSKFNLEPIYIGERLSNDDRITTIVLWPNPSDGVHGIKLLPISGFKPIF